VAVLQELQPLRQLLQLLKLLLREHLQWS